METGRLSGRLDPGVGTGIVDGIVDVMLEHHLVDGGGWKFAEGLELV